MLQTNSFLFIFLAFVYLIRPANRVFYEGGTARGSEERELKLKCVVPENIHTPNPHPLHGGLDPPCGISIPEGACHTPTPLGFP